MNALQISSLKKVLLLGPHPDDIEFSSAGFVKRMKDAGVELHYAVFSMCEKSVPAGMDKDVIKKELLKAAEFMGIKRENLYLFDYEVRIFPEKRQEILEDMVKLNRKLNPDLVLLPCSSDIHQDHETIHREGIRAFKNNMILGYEMPWNNFNFDSHVYVMLSEDDIRFKTQVLELYKSQSFRFYRSEEYVRSLATIRGIQVQSAFAESFEVIRLKLS
ncbi:MAG: PIG-L family deacetylase [Bacteroidetes bacterium]|nr:MAG: PIG-L family deacetylase [Bacteroidota bacterium]REK07666.1 MAG: PIG-L family deacetylase [Bacteroidota bacterium]REK33734.1 MAG: PIG-L family deacetylase [Bacteroidota bacterium]REK49204.1 MAG: PIG-L family deacetylase [Bacteroidota bacterium]